jgi:hypothetical protein
MKYIKAILVIINITFFVWGIIISKSEIHREFFFKEIRTNQTKIEELKTSLSEEKSNFTELKIKDLEDTINALNHKNTDTVYKYHLEHERQKSFNRLVAIIIFINALFLIVTLAEKSKNNT